MARRRFRRNSHGQRLWATFFKLSFGLAFLAALAGAGYVAGRRDGAALLAQAVARAEASDAQLQTVSADAMALRGQLDEARARADAAESLYRAVVASDDVKAVAQAARARLDAGVDAKRLLFVLNNAEKPRKCTDVVTKRFMVKTERLESDATWVRFGDLVTVTAQGVAGNGSERLFDPSKPIRMQFTQIGGKAMELDGVLPLQYSMMAKGSEYRFNITAGERGFVDVASDRCDAK